MKAYNKFIKKVKKTNIEVSEYRFLDGAGWIKSKDYDNLPNNLKKAYYWELENLNEDKLKQLQSNAVNELSLLNDEQLKKTLKRLDLLNDFERFNEFIKSFYVKVDNNTYNGLDVSDFKILLDQCFYVDVPNNGNISIEFLTELTDQFFFKSSLLDGLKWQIENLLEPQQTKKPQPELRLKQIALKYVYLDKQITEHNGNEIAKKYGWNSGRKLWQHFNTYYVRENRKGAEDTKKKTRNKIDLIESVIPLLPNCKQEKPKDEVEILKNLYKTEY